MDILDSSIAMSLTTTSIVLSNAEMRYNTAALNLQKVIPKSTQSVVLKINYPTTHQQATVGDRAKVLERAIDSILRYRNDLKDSQKKRRIGDTVIRWFRASYPFTNLFLGVMKDGSAVFVPFSENGHTNVCVALCA